MVQNVRLTLIVGLLILFLLCFYVLGKLSIVYFIFWAVFFMLIAEVMLSCAAGRQRLERKMRRELNLEKGSSTTARVKLPEDEQTFYWRTAIRLYDLSLPFYLMCLVMFYIPGMHKDVACTLRLLSCTSLASSTGTTREQCLEQRNSCPETQIGEILPETGGRWPIFVTAMWMPLLVVCFELAANRMVVKWQHVSYQFIMWFSYWFATMIGEVLIGYPVFPTSFDWQCANNAIVPGNDCWTNLISTMLLMLALQCTFFALLYFAHDYRNRKIKEKMGN